MKEKISIALKYLLLVLSCAAILHFGKSLFIPMFFGLLVAIVVYPLCKKMEQKGVNRGLAIGLLILLIGILGGILVLLLAFQVQLLQKDIPGIVEKLRPTITDLQDWITARFSISMATQDEWFMNEVKHLANNAMTIVGSTINATISTLFMFFMIPIFTALFLYNREVFVKALRIAVRPENQGRLQLIINNVVSTYFNYIKGMVMIYIIVGILNSIGLLLLGIRYAILFGMLTAIMTIIPYVGIVVSALLPISVAFVTKDSIWYPLGVVGVFSFVQYLEANVIFPKIVGMQLNVSTWATLVAILLGGIIWGVSGMVLFIPFVAILKIVTDYIEELKPINILLSRS